MTGARRPTATTSASASPSVLAEDAGFAILANEGSGAFALAATVLTKDPGPGAGATDLNGDGRADFVAPASVLLGDGTLRSFPTPFPSGPILGPGLANAMIAVAIVYLPHYTRLTRGSVIGEMSKDYVTASRVSGAGLPRLMFATVLPNCMAPLIVQATLGFSNAILDAAALGFLGLGAQPPTPEWGTMLADAREFVLRAWWVVTFPGLAILITVLAFNLMGDGLRDALDPKLKRS